MPVTEVSHRKLKQHKAKSTNHNQFVKTFVNQPDAAAALREVGNSIVLPELIWWQDFGKEIDRAFGDRPFHESLSLPQNIAHAKAYIEIRGGVIGRTSVLVDLLAKTLGINFNDLEGSACLLQCRNEADAAAARASQKESGVESIMRDLVHMGLAKSAKFGMPLPPKMLNTIEKGLSELDRAAGVVSGSGRADKRAAEDDKQRSA